MHYTFSDKMRAWLRENPEVVALYMEYDEPPPEPEADDEDREMWAIVHRFVSDEANGWRCYRDTPEGIRATIEDMEDREAVLVGFYLSAPWDRIADRNAARNTLEFVNELRRGIREWRARLPEPCGRLGKPVPTIYVPPITTPPDIAEQLALFG